MPSLVSAGVDEAVTDVILPAQARFASETANLAAAAEADCTPETLKDPWNDAFDAWLGVAHLRLGPIEEEGRGLAISFWPDTRGMMPRSLAGMIADRDAIVDRPDEFGQVSVAARGLFALEQLLYEPDFSGYSSGSYTCRLATAIAEDLARMAGEIEAGWRDGFAAALTDPGGSPYLTDREAVQALYTALATGLEYNQDQRLGRPLGTLDRPRPTRAEAWRSERSVRNVILSLTALEDLAEALADTPIPETTDAFGGAIARADALDDPALAGVEDPAGRFRIEALQTDLGVLRRTLDTELGTALGVSAGFNSMDGD
ncbi:imelysin family protein [Roseicyclus sp. F158]|uniref:Imelysin family protein n=1 Tax=Tropicimonas omnivorans TaxID=3075590 RepID=A0ABU3DBZ6_9RHOB|nr:imelysin family protein [Roseicyclus sp. F158]MDT0681231.1 imelysin family protein [Roseicyclus sp. F158]